LKTKKSEIIFAVSTILGRIIRATVFIMFFLSVLVSPASAIEYLPNTLFFNGCFGIGTFSAGENDDGSVFLGNSVSVDWIPNHKIGLSYGLESGLLGGEKKENIIFGVPIIFRIGWYPTFLNFSNFDIFIIGKAGWAFGIWGQNANVGSTPNGIVCGFNFGGRYLLTQNISLYGEIGYNYYGLARSSNYPEYPLGYGSGKTYAAMGISYKLGEYVRL
jgi:hypothetical protein